MIKLSLPGRFPWFTLLLLCLTYILVGWKLAIHHLFWFGGFFITSAAAVVAWNSNPWMEGLIGFGPQALFTFLMINILVVMAVTSPGVLTVILMPLLATFLAWLEVRLSGYDQPTTLAYLVCLSLISLGVGELIDLLLLPSLR